MPSATQMDKVLKVLAATALLGVSLACLAYIWEAYERYKFHEVARTECRELEEVRLSTATPQEQAGAWAALQYCLTKAQHGIK